MKSKVLNRISKSNLPTSSSTSAVTNKERKCIEIINKSVCFYSLSQLNDTHIHTKKIFSPKYNSLVTIVVTLSEFEI